VTDQPNAASNSRATPEELLATVDVLRRRTRAAQHAYWLPLLLFGLLMVIPAPLYVDLVDAPYLRTSQLNPALTSLGGDLLPHSTALGWYWLSALIGGYLLSLGWYRWRGERVGVHTPTRAYLVAGIAGTLAGLVSPIVLTFVSQNTDASIMTATSWFTSPLLGLASRGMLPHVVIAVGLVVLAWLERSRDLWTVVTGYVAAVLLVNLYFNNADFESGNMSRYSLIVGALLPALVLLVGGAVALLCGSGTANRTAKGSA
jgi:hypothetical protein